MSLEILGAELLVDAVISTVAGDYPSTGYPQIEWLYTFVGDSYKVETGTLCTSKRNQSFVRLFRLKTRFFVFKYWHYESTWFGDYSTNKKVHYQYATDYINHFIKHNEK